MCNRQDALRQKFIYSISFIVLLSVASSVQAVETFSLVPVHDAMIGNDEQMAPDENDNSTGMHIRNNPARRRVSFASYDISQVKTPGNLPYDMGFSNYGHDRGTVLVYGVLEEFENIDETTITWNNAPGIQNEPTPELGDPVALDYSELTDLLMTFRPPVRGTRESTEPNQALTDFVNSDTNGIVTFLFAPPTPEEGDYDAIVRSKEHEGGGTWLEGYYRPPPEALKPNPSDGQIEVPRDAVIEWRPGGYTEKHNVYFGTVLEDVNQASIDDPRGVLVSQNQNLEELSYDPVGLLEFGRTYYWRVDEVNDLDPNSPWKGDVWSFTAVNFTILDDFEAYDANNAIFDTWVDFYANNTGMTVGYFDPPFVEQTIVRSGSQAMYLRYDNDGTINEGTDYELSGTLLYSEAERQWELPQDWTEDGAESLTVWFRGIRASVGDFTVEPPIYTVTAAGSDIWTTADEFHFAYKQLSSAGTITAKVVSITNTNTYAKAGVMFRDTLDANSKNVMMLVTAEGGIGFQRRIFTRSTTAQDTEGNIAAPYWVRLTRDGNKFTAGHSADGVNWESLGSVSVTMAADAYVGLAVTAHNANATCVAEFSDVTISGTTIGEWQSQDIGIISNIPEPMYIVLADSAENSAVVKNPDEGASAAASWTEWNIPFTDFTGVNMQAVKKMSIGVGDRANTQPSSAGDLYIDDIRLYLPQPVE